jgi:hypothetical protein
MFRIVKLQPLHCDANQSAQREYFIVIACGIDRTRG